ncbi:hypothetical protein [Burkholderia glumae]|uniref:hypothetical protein n=1 Tax=Burkholderia glumae TaxID=337 RepID=UPI0021516954|nr:hypothetical protein [Burkholderia glumae]
MYVKQFLFVSHSYLRQRDDALCGWPAAEPPAPPWPPASGGQSCHDRQTGMPARDEPALAVPNPSRQPPALAG